MNCNSFCWNNHISPKLYYFKLADIFIYYFACRFNLYHFNFIIQFNYKIRFILSKYFSYCFARNPKLIFNCTEPCGIRTYFQGFPLFLLV